MTKARAFSLSIVLVLSLPRAAFAYEYDTHSKIVERAVDAMQALSDSTPPTPAVPAGVTAQQFSDYLDELKAAPAKLGDLSTGLPNKLQATDFDPIAPIGPGDEQYPFHATYTTEPDPNHPGQTIQVAHQPKCEIYDKDDLSNLSDFRISAFDYEPQRTTGADGCGLTKIDNTKPAQVAKVLGKVLGWHAGKIDDHFNDAVMWMKPTNVAGTSVLVDVATVISSVTIGAIIALPYCVWKLFHGDSCSVDEIYALAEKYNPTTQILGALPGFGDFRSDTYTGLWHFIHLDRIGDGDFNNIPGMHYPDAGPSGFGPGAADFLIMAGADIVGMSLNAYASDGDDFYGDFDEVNRLGPAPWMVYSMAHLEFSPLDNLAAYGWKKYVDTGASSASGLGWPLHAIGDACAPHHVIGSSSWGHVPYEMMVDANRGQVLSDDPAERAAQINRILTESFRWSKLLDDNNGDVQAFITELANETRTRVRDQGEWAYDDLASIEWTSGFHATAADHYVNKIVQVQDLIDLSSAAAIALLHHAATMITQPGGEHPTCPAGATFQIGTGCVGGQPLSLCALEGPSCNVDADCGSATVFACRDHCCLLVVD